VCKLQKKNFMFIAPEGTKAVSSQCLNPVEQGPKVWCPTRAVRSIQGNFHSHEQTKISTQHCLGGCLILPVPTIKWHSCCALAVTFDKKQKDVHWPLLKQSYEHQRYLFHHFKHHEYN